VSTVELGLQEIHRQVTEAWEDALPGSDPTAAFFDQGGTSVRAFLLIADLETRLGVRLPFAVLAEPDGTDDIVRWVSSHLR
jgi:acyl carrier protein